MTHLSANASYVCSLNALHSDVADLNESNQLADTQKKQLKIIIKISFLDTCISLSFLDTLSLKEVSSFVI
jgi:hypothetical protein